jgi:hypothetical protein
METTPVNIRVSTDDTKNETVSKFISHNNNKHAGNVYEDFLVTTNKEYRTQIFELQSKLMLVEKEKDEYETDNEKIETSQRYMRGILKNYYAIDQYNAEMKNQTMSLLLTTRTSSMALQIFVLVVLVCSVIMGSTEEWKFIIPPIIVLSLLFIKIYERNVASPAHALQKNIESRELEIETIKKTNELLPDLFDHL